MSEHGTDRSAQILFFCYLLKFYLYSEKKLFYRIFFSKIFILLGLIISLKAFYVLYLLIILPIFIFLKKQNIKN